MAKKLDAKKLKEEFDALEPDEQSTIRKALGVSEEDDDDDSTSTIKKLIERVTALEGLLKERTDRDGKKKGSFFGSFFE